VSDNRLLVINCKTSQSRHNDIFCYKSIFGESSAKRRKEVVGSTEMYCTCGVVQGSCLGPLLFLVYINDVWDIFKSVNYKLYADDVKLYTELKTAADESCFKSCLDLLYSWSVTSQLAISSKKCCIATIGKLGDSWR